MFAELAQSSPCLDPRQHTAAIVHDMEKLVLLAPSWAAALGQGALYDLAADPEETCPVSFLGGPDSPARARAEAPYAVLQETQRRLARAGVTPPERQPLDEEQRRKLRALGYAN